MLAQGQSFSAKRGGLATDVNTRLIFLTKKRKKKGFAREVNSEAKRLLAAGCRQQVVEPGLQLYAEGLQQFAQDCVLLCCSGSWNGSDV